MRERIAGKGPTVFIAEGAPADLARLASRVEEGLRRGSVASLDSTYRSTSALSQPYVGCVRGFPPPNGQIVEVVATRPSREPLTIESRSVAHE